MNLITAFAALGVLLVAPNFVFSQAGGEDCSSATVIGSVPFVGQGSTSGANDDYFESCPDVGNLGGAPDHVYQFTNGNAITVIDASLCQAVTNYDSQLYIYEGTCGGNLIGCQEDGCQSPAYTNAYNSTIQGVILQPNTTYYFVIDGYDAGSSGNYQLNIDLVGAPPDSSEIPLVYIETGYQTIPDEPKLSGTMHIIYNGPGVINHATDPYNEYDGTIGIELRGSSSSMFPKKSYGLETRTALDSNLNVSLFGMPAENDWVLHGPYSDKSLLRNELAYYMGSQLTGYSPRTQFCELIIDGVYRGVYLFTEKIKRDPGRVNIARLTPTETFGDDLTGGYIIKIDKLTGGNNDYWTSPYTSNSSNPQPIRFLYHYPKPDSIVPEQRAYIQNYITSFENILNGANYQDPFTGYRSVADINSFVDYFLLAEATRNVDGYRISTFMFKDKESKYGKLRIGPPWDYNIAFGNANYCQGGEFNDWAYQFNDNCSGDPSQVPFWWERLMSDPEFQNRLRCRWDQLRAGPYHTDSIMAHIDSQVMLLQNAQQRNFDRWDVLGNYIWPNNYIGNTYVEEITYLKFWVQNRLNWMDQNLPTGSGDCTFLSTAEQEFPELRVFPNPSKGSFYIEFAAYSNQAEVSVMDVNGRLVWEHSFEGASVVTLHTVNIPELSELRAGMYYITLNSGVYKNTVKFVKQ